MTLDAVLQDVRHAIRRLARDWRFTAAAVLILGLGIGANTAIFSAVNAALVRRPAYIDPTRLVDIYQNVPNGGGPGASSYPAYQDIASYTDLFASTTAASIPSTVKYQDGDGVRSALAEYATPTYLTVLGLQPALGRWFVAAEDTRGAPVVAVLGYQTWIRRFGADPGVVGRTIRVEGVPVTIVGVGPARHTGTVNLGIVTDFWLPITAIPALGGPVHALDRRPEEAGFIVKARLRDGVTVAHVQDAMSNLGRRLAAEYRDEDPGAGISVFASSSVRVHPQMDGLIESIAALVLAVTALVLAIACSNLATLLLVRGAARTRELATRRAIGATRGQLVRHLLTESVLLSAGGGGVGCLLAWWAMRALRAFDLPVTIDLRLDDQVLIFAAALSLATGIALGVAPALNAATVELVPALRDDRSGGSTARRLTVRNVLVVWQVALSVLLLGTAGVFLQMLDASRAQRTGYAVDGVAMLETDPRYAGYTPADAATMYEELRRRIAAIPGVQSATLTRGLPMDATGLSIVLERGSAAAPVRATSMWAGPGFFATLNIPVLYGRVFDERDGPKTPRVAVLTEGMARKYFGVANAVGHRFRFEQEPTGWIEVIGIVRDTGTADRAGDLVDPSPGLFYRSFRQSGVPPTAVVASGSIDAAALAAAMQRELRTLDAALPILAAKTMSRHIEESLLLPKTLAAVLAVLGLLGLGLAAIGVYAVIGFTVSQRSREIGIRMALGARAGQVVWTVARQVGTMVAIGTAAGLLLSIVVTVTLRVVSAPAPGVANVAWYRPTVDPMALLSIASFIALVGTLAGYMPARRAATMDPAAALRAE